VRVKKKVKSEERGVGIIDMSMLPRGLENTTALRSGNIVVPHTGWQQAGKFPQLSRDFTIGHSNRGDSWGVDFQSLMTVS
jgi:hypothetical protein